MVIAPVGVLGVQHAGAAAGTSCSQASGTATFNPGFAKVNNASPEANERKITISAVGTVSGCTGGGVKSGTTKATIKIADETNCNELLAIGDTQDTGGEPFPAGTLTTTWNTRQTSTASVVLQPVKGQITQTHIHGKVTAGLFKGLTVDSTVSFSPKTGNCFQSDLKAVTYKNVGNTAIH